MKIRVVGVGIALFAILATMPASARADYVHNGPACQTIWRFDGERRGWHKGQRPPLVLGDSTMIFATRTLNQLGFAADARGCRDMEGMLGVMRAAKRRHCLPKMVIILAGSNGILTRPQILRARKMLSQTGVLVMLTPREEGGGSGADARLVRRVGREHRRGLRVLDWQRYARTHSFGSSLHITMANASRMARYIARNTRRWWPPTADFPCNRTEAQRQLNRHKWRAGTPVCGDTTGDRINDMVIPIRPPGAAVATGWRMYVHTSGEWRLRYLDFGGHFSSYELSDDFRLARNGKRDITLRANTDCAACSPGDYWTLHLRWKSGAFVVRSAVKTEATP